MCGRYALTTPPDVLAAIFRLAALPNQLQFRYNIAPTQQAPVVVQTTHGRALQDMRWGLIPCWARDESIGNRMINARRETAGQKRIFRAALERRRCIVPASGFYEWKKSAKAKQPYFLHRADNLPLALAGLWDTWRRPDGEKVRSFTILTTEANGLVRDLHDRMPVILEPEVFDRWLDPEVEDTEALQGLMSPAAEGLLEARAVSRRVNSPRNDDPSLLEPCEPAATVRLGKGSDGEAAGSLFDRF